MSRAARAEALAKLARERDAKRRAAKQRTKEKALYRRTARDSAHMLLSDLWRETMGRELAAIDGDDGGAFVPLSASYTNFAPHVAATREQLAEVRALMNRVILGTDTKDRP